MVLFVIKKVRGVIMKNSGILICIFVALLCLCTGILGTYTFMCKDKCETVSENKQNEEEKEGNNTESKEEGNKEEESSYLSDYERLVKRIDELAKIEYFNKNFKVEELSNYELLTIVPQNIKDAYSYGFSLEDANKITKKFYGVEVTGEDIFCEADENVKEFIYDALKKYFVYNNDIEGAHSGHGVEGKYNPSVLNRIVHIDVQDNLYIVEVKKAFNIATGHTGYFTDYYRTYADALNKQNVLFDLELPNGAKINDEINNYFVEAEFNSIDNNRLVSYTYEFEKREDNNFILKSYSFR